MPLGPLLSRADNSSKAVNERARRNIAELAIAECTELTEDEEGCSEEGNLLISMADKHYKPQKRREVAPTALIMIDTTQRKVTENQLGFASKQIGHVWEQDSSQGEQRKSDPVEEASLRHLLSYIDEQEIEDQQVALDQEDSDSKHLVE